MKSGTPNLNSVFSAAANQALISPASLQTLTTMDLGNQIQNALGISADAIDASEVFLLSILVDDSSSIRDANNEDNVRNGVNLVLESLGGSKAENEILVHMSALNRGTLTPFIPLNKAPRLDAANYRGQGSTPLYDKSIAMLGTVLAKEREFAGQGVATRTLTLIVTDGADCGSTSSPRDVAPLVSDLRKRENHIILAMGIDDGGTTDFRAIFGKMGIQDQWVLTPGNSPSEIRRAFVVASKSAVQASQGAAAFSKVTGIGTP